MIGSFYDGYIKIKKTKLNITIVKEEYCGYCKKCGTLEIEPIDSEYIENRLTCNQTDEFHYVVYKKIEFNLATFVDSTEYNETSVISITKDLINAILTLHNKNQFHLNLNPDAIKVYKLDHEYKVKLLDFFMSREDLKHPIVPLRRHNESIVFSAPELLKFRKNDENLFENPTAADIFSLGVCLFFVFTKSNPFERAGSEIEENIMNENYKIDYRIIGIVNLIAEYKKYFLKDVIVSMLKYVPNERSSLQFVIKNPLFWDKYQLNQFLKKNTFKIMNPNTYLQGSYLNEGEYKNIKQELKKWKVSKIYCNIKIYNIFKFL